MDCSTPGFPVHHQLSELAQALLYLNLYIIIILISSLNRVQLFATPWTVAHEAPPSVEFSRQEYWSGLPFPSPGDLPGPGIEPRSPALRADALPSEPPEKPSLQGGAQSHIPLTTTTPPPPTEHKRSTGG